MIEQDTIRLLRECDAGIKMGVESIDDVLGYIKDSSFRNIMKDSKDKHCILQDEIDGLLEKYQDDGKNPNPIAVGMSKIMTNVKLGVNESDSTIADVMTDGCNMGVKSLHRYLNEYKAADEKAKDITKRLINIEERLALDIRNYL